MWFLNFARLLSNDEAKREAVVSASGRGSVVVEMGKGELQSRVSNFPS
jgi:hypothetical protein